MNVQADTRQAAEVQAGADREQGEILLKIARAAIASRFGLMLEYRESEAFLSEPGASFVTLKQNGRLRGCIGTLEAHRPLVEDVVRNAAAAALDDYAAVLAVCRRTGVCSKISDTTPRLPRSAIRASPHCARMNTTRQR